MGPRILAPLIAALLWMSLAGCDSNEDKYVVKTPVPPQPQQGQGTGH